MINSVRAVVWNSIMNKSITIQVDTDTYNDLLELLECYKKKKKRDYWYRPNRIRVLVRDLLEKKVSEELAKAKKELENVPKNY